MFELPGAEVVAIIARSMYEGLKPVFVKHEII